MKPLIAIPSSFDGRYLPASERHLHMVALAGGVPSLFGTVVDPEDVVELADGILLVEGPDIHPRFYGDDPSPKLRDVDVARDEFEIELVKLAMERGIPLMGIGRGMHVINVALGGTLYQDVYEIPKAIKHDWDFERTRPEQRLHTVRVKADSLLYSIIKESLNIESTNEAWTWVNSFHHQAVKKVGEGLRPVAFAIDGLVEAIEGTEGFILGVQWQPEFLSDALPLYKAFVNAAVGRHEEHEELLKREIEAEVREELERELSEEQGESHHSSETSDILPDTNQT
jgi:putative glutamine amidotransferase